MARNNQHTGQKPPSTLTVLLSSPKDMHDKLFWDVEVFSDIQRSHPVDKHPLVYAAINVCISAWSLRKWAESYWIRSLRSRGQKVDEDAFSKAVQTNVPDQAMCEAIANTAKHANHRDGNWPEGEVKLSWVEGDESMPSSFILYHSASGETRYLIALNTFDKLRRDWWNLLVQLGIETDEPHKSVWYQNKIRKIFGHPIIPTPPEG